VGQIISYDYRLDSLLRSLFFADQQLSSIMKASQWWWIFKDIFRSHCFIIFLIASTAETNLELLTLPRRIGAYAGFNTDIRNPVCVFLLAEYMNMFIVAIYCSNGLSGGWMPCIGKYWVF